MTVRKFCLLIVLSLMLIQSASAQDLQRLEYKKSTVCYGVPLDNKLVIPPPAKYMKWKNSPGARVQTSTFVVSYTGFTPQAQAAFQKAVDIWSTLITTNVPIRVNAEWKALAPGVLGSAIWGSAFANFPAAPQVNTYYPVALAEKIANRELNSSAEPDVVANFSSTTNWSYDLNGIPKSGTYDLVTVVLHELGHGLGFVDSYYVNSNSNGIVGLDDNSNPMIYDLSLENNLNQNLFINFISPSTGLADQLTSKNIFQNSPLILPNNSGSHAKIYAPTNFSPGSSISHLDELTFNSTANALMTPGINMAEVMHDPGPIVKSLFSDMGWIFTRIEHNKLLNQENTAGPFIVKAKVTSDLGSTDKVYLNYNTGAADSQVEMALTAGEYSATLPTTNVATTYSYYISTTDALRLYTNPGKLTKQGTGVKQTYFTFTTGPDTVPPVIVHTPKEFIRDTDTELSIDAIITDNLGIEIVSLEYRINDVEQPSKHLLLDTGSSYSVKLTFPQGTIHNGDTLKYRIIARDTAYIGNRSGNVAYSPSSTTYHRVKIIGFQPAQNYYFNDFNSSSTDFYGENFTITTPGGFSNGCINSEHPYKEGRFFPGGTRSTTYQLFTPIRIKSIKSTIKFDEIVLVEPGQYHSPFDGTYDFFDYAVLEGSIDGGKNWVSVSDKYDARGDADWYQSYNPTNAFAKPSLFKTRELNLLTKFTPGQIVVFRFRLFSDPYTAGWGWAIDNLKIQIDETPPLILHDHVDYIPAGPNKYILPIKVNVTDKDGVKNVVVQYKINDGAIQTISLPEIDKDLYLINVDLSGATKGDKVFYRITATDNADFKNNASSFPSPTGFITVVLFEPDAPVSQYVNDFNAVSNDFIGNFFNVSRPDGFMDGSINTDHFYSNGFGLDFTSNFSYMLKKPIILNAINPHIRFSEIAIVEDHDPAVAFGSQSFNDYAIVEGSSDGGITWVPFLDGYDAMKETTWLTAFRSAANGTKQMFKNRTINMLAKSGFHNGDHILVRFRLFSNRFINGWGWAIDNLLIQSPVTGDGNVIGDLDIRLYPNPAQDRIYLEFEPNSSRPVRISIINASGATISDDEVPGTHDTLHQEIETDKLSAGLYLIKIQTENGVYVRKVAVEQ